MNDGASLIPQTIRGILDQETFAFVKLVLETKIRPRLNGPYGDRDCMRHKVFDLPFFFPLHDELTRLVSERLNRKVKRTYSLVSMYGPEGVCPAHKDRPQCEYTISLCVSQNYPWPLYICDVEYLLNENDGILFNGTKQIHYRPRIGPQNHCDVILFHFVDEEFSGPLHPVIEGGY